MKTSDELCMSLNTSNVCNAGYCYLGYLDTTVTPNACKLVTPAIVGAATYTNATTPATCLPGYYLDMNTSPYSCKVLDNTVMANCDMGVMAANNAFTCAKCKDNFTLSFDSATTTFSCVTSTTANCSVTNCLTCTTDPYTCLTCSG